MRSLENDVTTEIKAEKGDLSPELEEDVPARLAWKDLSVIISCRNGELQNVLVGANGYAEEGTFTCVMGPSGSGKSTLLDALFGRLPANAFLSGTILLNGRKAKLSFGTAVSICLSFLSFPVPIFVNLIFPYSTYFNFWFNSNKLVGDYHLNPLGCLRFYLAIGEFQV